MKLKALFSSKWICHHEAYYTCSTKSLQIKDWSASDIETLEEMQVDFACVQQVSEEGILVITDRFSTVPVYVCYNDGEWYISDYLSEIKKRVSTTWNRSAIEEQLLFDYVFSHQATIYNEIIKVESGVKVLLRTNGQMDVIDRLSTSLPKNRKGESLSSEQILELGELIKDYILPHKSLYIPLSGGLDSRLVCGLSAQLPNSKIWSRTYGDPQSLDVKYGTQVAQKIGVRHQVIAKTNERAIADFEAMVVESAGMLNGVHAHDLEGRLLFEESKDYTAKVSGFIGDVFARGTNMKETRTDAAELAGSFIQKWTNLLNYDYQTLGLIINEGELKAKASKFIKDLKQTEDVHWAFYQKVRIPNMVSMLEYHSTITKPNIKPFIVPKVRTLISEYAGRDEWEGMNYVEIAKALIPNLIKIPFASNSVFYSKEAHFMFRLRKKFYRSLTNSMAKYSGGKMQPLPFNATLNWRRILAEESSWVKKNMSNTAEAFQLNSSYLNEIYEDHKSGNKDHQEFLLRIINLGVLVSK